MLHALFNRTFNEPIFLDFALKESKLQQRSSKFPFLCTGMIILFSFIISVKPKSDSLDKPDSGSKVAQNSHFFPLYSPLFHLHFFSKIRFTIWNRRVPSNISINYSIIKSLQNWKYPQIVLNEDAHNLEQWY